MIVPCIDLQGGKVVQLVKGREKVLELDSLEPALDMFESFPVIHVIDLDAAMGRGDNTDLVREVTSRRAARVGGGIRSVDRASEVIKAGARQVIVGTRAFGPDGIDHRFLERLAQEVGRDRIIVALDCFQGRVTVKGWTESLDVTPESAVQALEPYCGGFLCTYVDAEGTMEGTDLGLFSRLRRATGKTMIAAGGIATLDEVRSLVGQGVEVALGMAVYTGRLAIRDLTTLLAESGSVHLDALASTQAVEGSDGGTPSQ